MIIAWGLFIFGIVGLFIGFYDKIKENEDFTGNDGMYMTMYYLVSLCSAQYIWG